MPTAHRRFLPLFTTFALGALALAHDGDLKLLDKQPAYMGHGWRNAQRSGTGGALLVTAPPTNFPANNVTLLSWLTLSDFGIASAGNGNSCFGYTAPSGREYALMGLSTGTAIVEVTQPGNATIIAQVAGPQSLWRDVRTYSHYAYAVSEGGSGIQVIDLANVDAGTASLVNTVSDDAFGQTHTLEIDVANGYLYRCGGAGLGLRIYDVHTNPAVPTRVGTWSDRYVHEMSVFTYTQGPAAGKRIAFCCGGLSSGFVQTGLYVVDVTNPAAPALMTYVTYPNAAYAHQAWPSPDLHWLYLDDELDERNFGISSVTRVLDISDPANTALVGTFTDGSSSIDHNQYTLNDKLFQANYRSGLHVFQTSGAGTPTSPVEIASFDTWPEDDLPFFNSLWNVYPYFPSGTVIGSDLERGLFVWWVGAPQVSFTLPAGVPTALDPAGTVLRVQLTGAIQPGSATFHYDVGAGFVAAPLAQAPNGDWLATLPPVACGTSVSFFFSARSPNGVIWSAPQGAPTSSYCAVAALARNTLASDDFEAANAGWSGGVAGDTATSGQWVRVDPLGTDLQPENDHSPIGTRCWVTGQGTNSAMVQEADVDGGVTTLRSPAFALAGRTNARIGYWRWYDNQVAGGSPPDDFFDIDVSNDDGSTWVRVEHLGPATADSRGGWIHHEFRVADFVAPTNTVRVRFQASDLNLDTHVEAGIDDFEVVDLDCTGSSSFCAGDGTLASCPCGNNGTAGHGCASSAFTAGAQLSMTGTPSVSADNVQLIATPLTGNAAIFIQSDATTAPFAIDDGLTCLTGTIIRLGTRLTTAGTAIDPDMTSAPLSVRGAIPASGATRYYQAFYRNAAASFCPPATSNRTNGLAILWAP